MTKKEKIKEPAAAAAPLTGLAAWGLNGNLTEAQELRRDELAMALNHGSFETSGIDRLDAPLLCAMAKAAAEGPDAVPTHMAMLAARRMGRTPDYRENWRTARSLQGAPGVPILPERGWFHWSQPAPPYMHMLLTLRRGSAVKTMLAAGAHPAGLWCKSLDGSDMPSPADCAELLAELSFSCSQDACAALFNALDAAAPDKASFREAAAWAARSRLPNIWPGREGVANATERKAVAQCAFLIERLAKKKTLPADLAEAAPMVAAKRAGFKGEEAAPAFEFAPLQIKRMKTLNLCSHGDDLEMFAAVGTLAGLDNPAAYERGVPKESGYEWPQGRYWTTKLAADRKFLCASWTLDRGDNPWLCAGDGAHSLAGEGNPFTWMAAQAAESLGYPQFCASLAKAALRDAETRSPGTGLEHCLASFEASRAGRPDLWRGKGAHAALAACEATLIPTMLSMERGASGEPRAAPKAKPRSRL